MSPRLIFGKIEDIEKVKKLIQDQKDYEELIESLDDSRYPNSISVCWKCNEPIEDSQSLRHKNKTYKICDDCGSPNIY